MTALPGASPFDGLRHVEDDGREWWSARELMPVMDYSVWRDFANAIERAKATCANSGQSVEENFAGARKVQAATGPAGADYRLSRYAAYLVAMNGDARKKAISDAQTYFAVKTREAETAPVHLSVMPTHSEALRGWAREIDAREAAEEYIRELIPKADYVDEFVSTDDLTRFRDAANQLGIPENEMREQLRVHRWIYREKIGDRRWSSSKQALVQDEEWRAYADHREHFTLRGQHNAPRHHNNQLRQTLYVTPAGMSALRRLPWLRPELEAS